MVFEETFLFTPDEAVPGPAAGQILAGLDATLALESEALEDRLGRLLGVLHELRASYRSPLPDEEWVATALARAERARPLTPYWMYPRQLEPLGMILCLMLSAGASHVFEAGPLARPSEDRFFLHKDLELGTTRFAFESQGLTRYLREVWSRQAWVAAEGIAFHVHFVLLAFAAIRYGAVCLALADGREEATRPEDVESAAAAFELVTATFPMFDQAIRHDEALGAAFRDPGTGHRLVGVLR